MERISLILADDHRIMREGLLAMLSNQEDLRVLAQASTGIEALSLIEEHRPRVAVLDYSMPSLDGVGVIEELRARGTETAFVLLTMHKERSLARRAVDAGAHGVVLKDDAFEDLIHAVRVAADGGCFVSPSFGEPADAGNAVGGLDHDLTRREREVLAWIARGHSNRKIGAELFISIKTVESHRANILHKLDAHTTAELTRYAIRAGLIGP